MVGHAAAEFPITPLIFELSLLFRRHVIVTVLNFFFLKNFLPSPI